MACRCAGAVERGERMARQMMESPYSRPQSKYGSGAGAYVQGLRQLP